MNYKFNNIVKKIFDNFIHGEYGKPVIPTKNDIMKKIKEYTSNEYTPILNNNKLTDLSYKNISTKFEDIIDDIDVLYSSIQDESNDILDQLTNSLKEYNGVNREINRIKSNINDINNNNYRKSLHSISFTESFNSLENIDTSRSNIVDINAGIFTIQSNKNNIVPLNHYIGKRLDFNIYDNYSEVLSNGFVGDPDVSNILDNNDSNQILYKIKTKQPSSLKAATTIQLHPNGDMININKVSIETDSTVGNGSICLYYMDKYTWKIIPNFAIKNIDKNVIIYNFSEISCTHIKIEFIKYIPDNSETNEYYILLKNISIGKVNNESSAVVVSKPININTTSIDNLSYNIDSDVPNGCNIKVYVTSDIKINGSFRDNLGSLTSSNSNNISSFDFNAPGYVYLSDIKNAAQYVSGLYSYISSDYLWKEITSDNTSNTPNKIYFNNTNSSDKNINSLHCLKYETYWGDNSFSGVYSDWIISGWCNESNPYWYYLEPMVSSGIFIYGDTITHNISGELITWIEDSEGNINPEVTTHPSYSGQWLGNGKGYPYNYASGSLLYGTSITGVYGWWRPYSYAVTPSGIDEYHDLDRDGYLDQGFCNTMPDFVFNNNNYYKIYCFGHDTSIISSSVKLYNYQSISEIKSKYDNINNKFVWEYNNNWTILNKTTTITYSSDNTVWSGYKFKFNIGMKDCEFVDDPIVEIRKSGTNVILQKSEYTVSFGKTELEINFLRLSNRLEANTASFDITYRYKLFNTYSSSWTGFLIVSPNIDKPSITINNFKIYDTDINGIGKIELINVDTNEKIIYNEQNKFDILLQNISKNSNTHFKIKIFCASNTTTGFTALKNSYEPWIPIVANDNISISDGIKIVPKLSSIDIVDFATLLYDTTTGENASIVTEEDGYKYLVVKEPSKDYFPGYYYDSDLQEYKRYIEYNVNNGHFIRMAYDSSGNLHRYTTGSSGNYVYNIDNTIDSNWNNGSILKGYENSNNDLYYRHHSTIGYPLNLEKDSIIQIQKTLFKGDIDPCPSGEYWDAKIVGSSRWLEWTLLENEQKLERNMSWQRTNSVYINEVVPNRGFLFYNTAENLPLYYSISYLTSIESNESNNSFLYKIELNGNPSDNNVPVIRSINFIINGE